MIIIDVLGTPAPKGSKRAFFKPGMKRPVLVEDNDERKKSWERAIRESALEVLGDRVEPVFVAVPVVIVLEFFIKRPAGHYRKKDGTLKPSAPLAPAVKPDGDKLARATVDPLSGLAFDDDARIVDWVIRKRYATPGREGARITIQEWKS